MVHGNKAHGVAQRTTLNVLSREQVPDDQKKREKNAHGLLTNGRHSGADGRSSKRELSLSYLAGIARHLFITLFQ
jgi:hypothetical protein